MVVSNEQRLSVVELSVENTKRGVCGAADNVTFVYLGRQTDGRYLTVVLDFRQHRRERSVVRLLAVNRPCDTAVRLAVCTSL